MGSGLDTRGRVPRFRESVLDHFCPQESRAHSPAKMTASGPPTGSWPCGWPRGLVAVNPIPACIKDATWSVWATGPRHLRAHHLLLPVPGQSCEPYPPAVENRQSYLEIHVLGAGIGESIFV